MSDDDTLYERLGVDPGADQQTIRRAYRRRARETHPDRNPNDPEAAREFRQVKAAYDVLSDPDRRSRYDAAQNALRSDAPLPDVVTATSVTQTGCVTYYLPRVTIGLVATAAFFILEVADVWRVDDPQTLLLGILGATVVTGVVALAVFAVFPDTTDDDYAVRFGPSDVRVWSEQQMVAQVRWKDVEALEADWGAMHLTLTLAPRVTASIPDAPPLLRVDTVDGPRAARRLHLDLSGTDVPAGTLRRFLHVKRGG